jgi:hypothetical protein
MKTRITQIFLPLLLVSLSLQGQHAEKTLVKAFNLQGQQAVLIDIDAPLEIVEWNQQQMRVVMTVSLENGSDTMLKSLVSTGRYNLDSNTDESGFRIFAPGLERQVKMMNGSELKEKITFEVFSPANVLVQSRFSESLTEKSSSAF